MGDVVPLFKQPTPGQVTARPDEACDCRVTLGKCVAQKSPLYTNVFCRYCGGVRVRIMGIAMRPGRKSP